MLSIIARTTIVSILLAIAVPAESATREEKRVADASEVLSQLQRIPEQAIPPSLLSNAYAVAVVPGVVKVGFGLGARRGKGVLVVRRDDGSWSNPSFVTLTGGSIGWQIGAQSTDVILVFKTRKGVDGIANGTLTLGADASIAAGPVGRTGAVATDIELKAEVVSYSRSRGLFAGVALEGSGVMMDRKANAAFYSSATMTPEQIFESPRTAAPAVANTFVDTLTAQTGQVRANPAMQAGSRPATRPDEPSEKPAVRTFGIPDPDQSPADDGAEINASN